MMSIFSVLAGIVVLLCPGISLLVLAVVLGVWLIAFGVMQITAAFRIRSLAAHAEHRSPETDHGMSPALAWRASRLRRL